MYFQRGRQTSEKLKPKVNTRPNVPFGMGGQKTDIYLFAGIQIAIGTDPVRTGQPIVIPRLNEVIRAGLFLFVTCYLHPQCLLLFTFSKHSLPSLNAK